MILTFLFLQKSSNKFFKKNLKTKNMKPLLFCLLLATSISCNNKGKQTDNTEKQTDKETPTTESSYDPKTGISDYTNNKKSFMLTCIIDASNSIGNENQDNKEQVKEFCECAWEKTKGKYVGGVVANRSKLEKDATLKECYENAIRK